MTLPLWVIKHITQPYGMRLPPPPAPFFRPQYTSRKRSSVKEVHVGVGWMKGGKALAGNLPNQDYEFWQGNLDGEYSCCRWCTSVKRGTDERSKHFTQSQHDCGKNIKECEKLLQKDSLCVICDKRTPNRKWGFPLCSEACVAVWKFDTYPSEAFRAVRILIDKDYYKHIWSNR